MAITVFGQSVIRPIYVLVWHQPFCSLMLYGKDETRDRPTNVRGQVLMVASKKPYKNPELFEMCGPEIMSLIIDTLASELTRDITGKAIAIGNLVDCQPMDPEDEKKCFVKYRKPWPDIVRGKPVTKNKWKWQFQDVRRIEPFEVKGTQGWGLLKTEQEINRIKYI